MGTDLGTETSSVLQSYLDLVWHDRLTSYDGKSVVYDSLGNPTSYNGTSYVWEGRQLKEVTNPKGKTQFEYDASGLRTEKRIYEPSGRLSMTVNYNWANGQIISQSMTLMATITYKDKTEEIPIGPITTKIIYDKSNQAVGFIVNGGITYMFVRNLQGDVIALVDDQGETVLEYSYDPWGKLEYHLANGMDEETAMILTAYCPLTYRGYNYDFSTGLYYLQSRYYNPEWGKFLNIDIYLETGHGVTGANVFAYCDNNPVNKNDPMGTFSKEDHYRYTHTFALNYFSKKYADIMARLLQFKFGEIMALRAYIQRKVLTILLRAKKHGSENLLLSLFLMVRKQ